MANTGFTDNKDLRSNEDVLLNNIYSSTEEAIAPGSTVYLAGTKKFTVPFFAITVLTDAVVDVSECDTGITESDDSGAMRATTTNLNIPAGITIYGVFHSIEFDSGTAIGYAKEGVTVTVEA